MMLRPRRAAPLACAILAACRTAAPPPAIPPDLSARVPPSTVALAGIDLDRLRASPLQPKLPPAAQSFLHPLDLAHYALVAYTGAEFLVIARGVVPGATQLAPDLALFGPAGLIASASAAHPPAAHPPAAILAPAAPLAARPIWLAVRGGLTLPLPGNLTNANNLLRGAEWVTLAVDPADPVDLQLVAQCPTPQAALHFEQSFRALVSLGIATTRQPAEAALLQSIHLSRQERTVRLSLSTPLDALPPSLF